jgi:hypothetical protein
MFVLLGLQVLRPVFVCVDPWPRFVFVMDLLGEVDNQIVLNSKVRLASVGWQGVLRVFDSVMPESLHKIVFWSQSV